MSYDISQPVSQRGCGEDNPPMYRAIKRVLDEIVKARMELRFKIINVNTERK